MSFHKILFAALLIFSFSTLFSMGSHAADSVEADKVAIRLLPAKTKVLGGETITVGIEQNIADGWHTYWVNPGDSGTAARVKWSGLEETIEAAPIQWPTPHRMSMGPLTNFGYEKNVVLLQDITLPQSLPDGPATITADVDILVCHDICIPESHKASFTINGNEDAVPAAVEIARGQLPLDVTWDATYSEDGASFTLDIITDMKDAFSNLKSIEVYPEEWGLILNPEKTAAVQTETGLRLTHPRGERPLSGVPPSSFVIAYDDSSGARKGLRVAAEASAPSDLTAVQGKDVGIIQAIFLALVGGLILNLMPCVFPVLSMKALSLVEMKDKEINKARLHGIVYTLGILISFAIIAGILIALKAGGAQIGWGFQLQNPAIILGLAYLFFALGLNLSGYFEINFGVSNLGSSLAQKGGLAGSFFTGVLATLVATPCTAPFMGVAMGYALTQSAFVAMMIFLSLGFGLALPYLLLTFVPALRHLLPRPGHWMETFRQFLAFPMFASTCWLVWVLSQQTDHMGVLFALLGLLALTFGIWLLKRHPEGRFWKAVIAITAILAFAGVASTVLLHKPDTTSTKTSAQSRDNWEDFSQAKLNGYLDNGNAVFINMTAAWCITCKVNEKVALDTDATRALFIEKNIKYLKGDWTNQNPEITKFLESYGRSGVPLYVYFASNDKTGEILPQILTPGIIDKTINP